MATALLVRCVQLERNGSSLTTFPPHIIAAVAGLFVLFGLWTSFAGAVLAIVELGIAFSHTSDPWLSVLLGSVGIVIALLGAGSWSLDARRSGWKRIEIRPRDS